MPQKNPVQDALSNVYEAVYNRKRAELDLERARAKEATTSRGAVPGVFASLQEMKMKEEKRREQIAKQGQAQAPPPQAMVPPMVDTSGQTGGRNAGAGLGIISDLAERVSGGGGLKRAGVPGGVAQQSIPQAGASAGTPAPGSRQGAIPSAPAATGSQLIPQTVPLSGLERGAAGASALLAIPARSPGALLTGATEAFKGERVVGYTTIDEMAQKFVPGLSVLEARRRDPDPRVSGPSSQIYEQRLGEIREINPAVADSAASMALDAYYVRDEQIRLDRETDMERVKRERAEASWGIEQKVIEGGIESLTHGERGFYEGHKRSTTNATTNIVNVGDPLQKSTRGHLEQELDKGRLAIQHLDSIDAAMPGMDWAFTWEGRANILRLREFKAKSPMLFGAMGKDQKKINDYARLEGSIASFNLPEIHELFGAAFTQVEMDAKEDLFPSMEKDVYTNKQDLKRLREDYGMALFRRELVLEKNTSIDPRYAMSLGSTKQAAVSAGLERAVALQAQGLSDVQALQQVRSEFKSRYGIDWDYLNGVHH